MTIEIKSMGYVRVASTDMDAWKTFAGKVLGLAEGRGPNPDRQYWRIDEVSARIVVFPSEVDQLDCSGWEVADHQALQAAREHLQKAGVEFEEGTKEDLDERRVQHGLGAGTHAGQGQAHQERNSTQHGRHFRERPPFPRSSGATS